MSTCQCGSKKPFWRLYDASGIYCCRVCDSCEETQKSKYRTEIFTDPNYQTDEPKEPEK